MHYILPQGGHPAPENPVLICACSAYLRTLHAVPMPLGSAAPLLSAATEGSTAISDDNLAAVPLGLDVGTIHIPKPDIGQQQQWKQREDRESHVTGSLQAAVADVSSALPEVPGLVLGTVTINVLNPQVQEQLQPLSCRKILQDEVAQQVR